MRKQKLRKVKDWPEVTQLEKAGPGFKGSSADCRGLGAHTTCSSASRHSSRTTQNWAHGPLQQIQGLTARGIPAASLPCTPLPWSLRSRAQVTLTGSPTEQVNHLGVPSAWRGPRGNEAKGKCLLAPSLPHAGATGSFRAVVAMQPCLFKESLAEARSTPAAGPGALQQPGAGQVWGHVVLAPLGPWATLSTERLQSLDSSSDRGWPLDREVRGCARQREWAEGQPAWSPWRTDLEQGQRAPRDGGCGAWAGPSSLWSLRFSEPGAKEGGCALLLAMTSGRAP